jgi:sugar phosphate permease
VRLTSDAFGKARAGVMFGWIVAAHQLGAATAALGAGAIRSWTGDYERAFLTSGALCLITAGFVLQIGGSREPEASLSPSEMSPEPAAG